MFNSPLDKRIEAVHSRRAAWSQQPGAVARICSSSASNDNGRWISTNSMWMYPSSSLDAKLLRWTVHRYGSCRMEKACWRTIYMPDCGSTVALVAAGQHGDLFSLHTNKFGSANGTTTRRKFISSFGCFHRQAPLDFPCTWRIWLLFSCQCGTTHALNPDPSPSANEFVRGFVELADWLVDARLFNSSKWFTRLWYRTFHSVNHPPRAALSFIPLCAGTKDFVPIWEPHAATAHRKEFRNLLIMQTVDPTASDRYLG